MGLPSANPLSPAALAAKAAADEAHFIKRARERFKLKLSHARYLRLVEKVEQVLPGTKYLGETPPYRTAWRIRFGGVSMRVIYDESTARLVTCMPFRSDCALGPKPARVLHFKHRLARRRRHG